jgi:hypothetical protein
MKAKVTMASIIAVILLVVCFSTQAQQVQSASIGDLRKQIQDLLTIDRDESTPSEVKNLNRKFITERRAQLHLLIEKKIEALEKYQSSVSTIITPDEKRRVEKAILDLRGELENLNRELFTDPGSETEVATTAVAQPLDAVMPKAESVAASSNSSSAFGRSLVNTDALPAPAQDESLAGTQPPADGKTRVEDQLRKEVEVERANIIDEVVNDVRGKTDAAARARAAETFSPTQDPSAYAKVLGLALTMNTLPRAQFTKEIEEARVDEQVGSSSPNSGGTSLVSKGSIPAILGLAVENGGLTRTNQATTLTFRGNLVGLFEAFAGKGFLDSNTEGDSLTIKRLRKLSFALSYDTSLGNPDNVFTGNRQQLSSYSFRYEFFNHRDPRDPRYTQRWKDLMVGNAIGGNAQAVATRANRVQNLFLRDAGLRGWLENARKAIASAPDAELPSVVRAQLDALETMELSPTVVDAVTEFSTAFSDYRRKREELLNKVENGPIFTFEYINNRRPGMIDTSNLNLIYSTGIAEGKASLTFNGAATIFNSKPTDGMGRLRDFNFSTQLDLPFGDPRGFGQFILSFAGQFKRLTEDELMTDGTILNAKGDIGTANFKLEIPIKNLGIRFPFSLSYSNRTEFDLRKQLRGNFGLAFDPDILFNLLKPFSRR